MHFFRPLFLIIVGMLSFYACQNKQDHNESVSRSDGYSVEADYEGQSVETVAEFVGQYTKGSDYHEFKDCSSFQLYQLAEKNNQLSDKFDSLNLKAGVPMFVRFNGTMDSIDQTSASPRVAVSDVVEASTYQGQSVCQLARDKTFVFRGNEPFWSLTISSDSIVFNHFEQDAMAFPYSPPQWQDSVWVVQTEKSAQSLTARISETECFDTMSGIRYSMQVAIETQIGSFEGCGGWEGREKTR